MILYIIYAYDITVLLLLYYSMFTKFILLL
jgi:hypothetical protein